MKFKKAIAHSVQIDPTINGGFIVTVGCVNLAFGGLKDLRKAMDEYLADPKKVMDEYEAGVDAGNPTQMPDQTSLGAGQAVDRVQVRTPHPLIRGKLR